MQDQEFPSKSGPQDLRNAAERAIHDLPKETTERVTVNIEEKSFDRGFREGYRCAVHNIVFTTFVALSCYVLMVAILRQGE